MDKKVEIDMKNPINIRTRQLSLNDMDQQQFNDIYGSFYMLIQKIKLKLFHSMHHLIVQSKVPMTISPYWQHLKHRTTTKAGKFFHEKAKNELLRADKTYISLLISFSDM